jgi:hypothetical protein
MSGGGWLCGWLHGHGVHVVRGEMSVRAAQKKLKINSPQIQHLSATQQRPHNISIRSAFFTQNSCLNINLSIVLHLRNIIKS